MSEKNKFKNYESEENKKETATDSKSAEIGVDALESEDLENTESKVSTGKLIDQLVYGKVSNCESLNIRKDPSLDAKPVCVVNKGDHLQVERKVVGVDADWFEVNTTFGIHGYCMSDYVSIE